MENLGKKLMLGGSMAAMLAAITASAAAQEGGPVESVEVSASRIQIQGYEAATPVTVIGIEQLNRDAKVDIGDAIRELPAISGRGDSPTNGSHSGNASQGDSGIDTVDLRGLGVVRTLVLFDGQRVVTSNPNSGGPPAIGGVDLSTIPSGVIERVDVVTGGASAAWGSDAVAGVVNLIINKTYTGFKANALFANDSHNDQKKYKLEAMFGVDFLGGRGHTEFAADYTMSGDTMYNWNRNWYNRNNRALYSCAVVNGGPANTLCHTPVGVYSNQFTNGGVIQGNPAFNGAFSGVTKAAPGTNGDITKNTPAQNLASNQAYFAALGPAYAAALSGTGGANFLKGIQFVGPTGQVPFIYGINNITPGSNAAGSNCYNCSANQDSNITNPPLTAVPFHKYNLFSYTSFKITPDISASLMLNYGSNAENNQANNGRQQALNIKVDNAFLPANIQSQLITNGIPGIVLGTGAMENLTNHKEVSIFNYSKAIGQNYVQSYRQLMRGVFTLNGNYSLFGNDWSWEAYAQSSTVRERQMTPYNTMNTNFANAVDSVVVQASGPNSLGGGDPATAATITGILKAAGVPIPAIGSTACRATLTQTSYGTSTNAQTGYQQLNPGGLRPGCVPLNIFGDGNVSQAALNYIAPGRNGDRSVMDQSLFIMNQQVYSVSTSGTLPWGLEAGKIAVALGFEDRLEQQRNTRDPLGLGATGVWESGNFSQFPDFVGGVYGKGSFNVQEGFLELNVPILKNNIVDSLDFDAAGRLTSYSTSGLVETWKLTLSSQINQDIKVRTTLSSDIRAPGVGELFSPILVSTQTQTYPPGGGSFSVKQLQTGSPALVPEQATTVSGGIVLTPHWIENLSLSFDWYSITIHGGIFSPSSGQIFSQCATNKNPLFCQFVFFGSGGVAGGVQTTETDANGNPGTRLLGGLTFTADAPGAFNAYLQAPVNANRETTSGLDFQVDYFHELFDGTLAWHILGNYNDEKTRTSLGLTVNGAGALSGDGALNPFGSQPKFHSTISSTYSEGNWSITGQARIIGSAVLTNNILQNQSTYISIDDNSVPAVIYGDFRGSYRWNDHVQFYAAVDNAFDAPPPNLPSIGAGGTSCSTYDCIGRSYRVGVRFDD